MNDARSAADAQSLQAHLERLKALRGPDGRPPARLDELKTWQAQRLARTYADIAHAPRYAAATAFFLDDLYAAKDFSGRDQAMLRILPVMSRMLPRTAVETAALAIELEALSEDLDHRLAAALDPGPIDARSYGKAYRETSSRAEREHQVDLLDAVGHRLDALVKKPLLAQTLKLMRNPARLAGMGDLQDFLERGFAAFRDMKGADDFLTQVRLRETAILNRLFSAAADPFSV